LRCFFERSRREPAISERRFGSPNRRVRAALLAIVLLGAGLRFIGLDHESLWNDELERYRQANQVDLIHVIMAGRSYDAHPPGFRVFFHVSQRVFGTSESALRFPGAVAGTLAIIAIFSLGRRLYSNREGLIAALFMAVMWCPIYYSQDAGPYPILMLLSIVTTLLWLPTIEALARGQPPARTWKLGYIVVGVIACWLHYFGLLLIGLQGLAALWIVRSKRQRLKPIGSIYLPIFVTFVPWVPRALRLWGQGPIWIPYPENIVATFVGYLSFLFNQSTGLSALVAAIVALAFLRELYGSIVRRQRLRVDLSSPTQLLAAWLTIPFLVVYVISLRMPLLTFRNLIILLPAAYLVLARSIARVSSHAAGQALLSVVVAAAFMYNLLYVKQYYTLPHKQQFREAVASIVQRSAAYPEAMIVGYGFSAAYFEYYFHRLGSADRIALNVYPSDPDAFAEQAIQASNPRYVWLVSGFFAPDAGPVNDGVAPDPTLINWLDRKFQRIDQRSFIKAGVWLYKNTTQ
jgi:mannosyltransferase